MRKVQSRSARCRRSIVAGTLVIGLMFVSQGAFAQDAASQPAPAAPAQQPAAAQPPPAPGLTFDGDAGLLFMQIKPDKTADFESVMAKLRDALTKTDKPERKQQAAGWKIFKSTEPGPNGNVLYVAIINPALKGADYTVAKILYEVFPTEVQTIFPTYRDSFAAGQSRTNLSLVQDFSAAGHAENTPAAPAAAPAEQK